MQSTTIFSEDIVQMSDLKTNPGRIVNQVDKTHRPVLLTHRGRGVAVVQALKDFETETEERAFMKGFVRGVMDLEEGREISLADVKKHLGLG